MQIFKFLTLKIKKLLKLKISQSISRQVKALSLQNKRLVIQVHNAHAQS